VLFVSGDGGWNLGVVAMAQRLRDRGALVAGIDIRAFLAGLRRAGGRCAYPAGDLEELARTLELRARMPAYRPPILAGYSSGATLVYGALAQAPARAFAGAISLGFCPALEGVTALCRGRALESRPRARGGLDLQPDASLTAPWVVLQGEVDQVCAPADTRRFAAAVPSAQLVALPRVGHGFGVAANWEPQYLAAYDRLAAVHHDPPPPAAAQVRDLPLVEVPAATGAPAAEVMAVIATGDGGWADIDENLAAGLAARGVPVVGWNSLRYYWTPRTPDAAAGDLARILSHYMAAWGKRRALLVGYSFGADVLPFLAARLPADLQARVAGVSLLGLSRAATFEFHVAGWLGREVGPQWPTVPEVRRIAALHVTCVAGSDETDSACHDLAHGSARVVELSGGHHFGGDYGRVVQVLLEGLR
jgi:type IV secretory pathway VirJ component